MTKELSKKIFEICGVAPIEGCVFNYYKPDCRNTICNEVDCCECCEASKSNVCNQPQSCDKCSSFALHFADLGEPENFVRLLNIFYKLNLCFPFEDITWLSAEESAERSSNFPSVEIYFLDWLADILDTTEDTTTQNIKQAIKNGKWRD
jgi:hypothetical protein